MQKRHPNTVAAAVALLVLSALPGFSGTQAATAGSADLKVTSGPVLYPGDVVVWRLRVENLGPNNASFKVNDVLDGLVPQGPVDLFCNLGSVTLIGGGGNWTGPIKNGETCRLKVTVLVNSVLSLSRTAQVTGGDTDPNLGNNSVVITGDTFRYPANATAQAVLVRRFEVEGPGGADRLTRLILGLFQGAPGYESAVLCSIPLPRHNPDVYTVPRAFVDNRWRECGEGLPYPLHVNDFYADQDGERIWLTSWGDAGLYYSDDGGFSWEAAEPSLDLQPDGWKNVYAITQDADGIYYISANNGLIFISPDGKNGWMQVASLPGGASDTPWSLTAHPGVAGTVYAGTFGNGVFVTRDFGQTWAPLHGTRNTELIVDGGGHVFDLEFSPASDTYLFAATSRDVRRLNLSDPNNKWRSTELNVEPTTMGMEVRSLAFAPNGGPDGDNNMYAATWGFGVFRYRKPLTNRFIHDEVLLRGEQIQFVAPYEGEEGLSEELVFAGNSTGQLFFMDASVSTANENPDDSGVPSRYDLRQNYPNPFNPTTRIEYSVPEASSVRLAVFDLVGREVAVLVDGIVPAGRQQVEFRAKGLPSGTYIYRLETGVQVITRHMTLLR